MASREEYSQNPTVHGLQPVAHIRQSTSKQHRHGVGHVGLGGLLVQFGGHDPPFFPIIFPDKQASVTILLVQAASPNQIRIPRRSSHGEKAEVGEAMTEREGELIAEKRRSYGEGHWLVEERSGGEVGFHSNTMRTGSRILLLTLRELMITVSKTLKKHLPRAKFPFE